jgi:hypothetical protein
MARTFVATSRGFDAAGINPANLAADDEGTLALSVLPLGLHVGSDFLNYDIYTTYFTGVQTDSGRVARHLSESDKQRILDGIGRDLATTTVGAEAGLLGLSLHLEGIGGLAFTVREQQSGYAAVPKDYAEFLLNGNPPATTFDFRGTDMKASWTREYALSLGLQLPSPSFLISLSFGAAAKLVHGFGYYETKRFDATLNTAENGALTGRVDFLSRSAGVDPYENHGFNGLKLFSAPAGRGFALDLGVAGAVNAAMSFGIAVTDIGKLRWTRNARETYADTTLVIDDPFVVEQGNAVDEALKGRKRDIASFRTALPTTLRMGVALAVNRLPGCDEMRDLLVGLDYNQGLYETPGSTKTPRVSLGVEYVLAPWLPLRSGVSFGGTDHLNVAFGLGVHLGMFELDLASENITWLFTPKSFSHGSAALGMQLRL